MNIFFKINGEIVTPALNGSILEGVTRNSVLQLLKHWGLPVTEQKISVEEIAQAHKEGKLEEAFGTGTAAVISPVGELIWKNESLVINNGETGPISQKLYSTITGIQRGELTDEFDWTTEVNTVEKQKVN
jgi:branched-chain amino acid aminotransferase